MLSLPDQKRSTYTSNLRPRTAFLREVWGLIQIEPLTSWDATLKSGLEVMACVMKSTHTQKTEETALLLLPSLTLSLGKPNTAEQGLQDLARSGVGLLSHPQKKPF